MFCANRLQDMLNYVLPRSKMVKSKTKKKSSFLRVVVNIVCERHLCASAVLGLFPVTKADGVQAFEKLHMPDIHKQMYNFVCASRPMRCFSCENVKGGRWKCPEKELYE